MSGKICGSFACRLGINLTSTDSELGWLCYECQFYLCDACFKIEKYLDFIHNLKMSHEIKLNFIDLNKSSENSTCDFNLI
jgi:hypothetical protein